MTYEYNDGSILLTGSSTVISTGDINTNISTPNFTTSTIQYDKKLEGVEFITNEEDSFIEIIYSYIPKNLIPYTFNSSSGKYMSKERYGVLDGKMQLIKTIKGIETPRHYVESYVDWEE